MSPYIIDWDGRVFWVLCYYGPLLPAGWSKLSEFVGPVRAQQVFHPDHLDDPGFMIGSAELGQEETVADPEQLTTRFWYVSPEECRVRAEQAYQTLRSSVLAENMFRWVSGHVDTLSLGSIMNGVVL